MVSQGLKMHGSDMHKHIKRKADGSLVDCLCECADNILRGNVPLTKLQKEKHKKNEAGLREHRRKSRSLSNRRKRSYRQVDFWDPY